MILFLRHWRRKFITFGTFERFVHQLGHLPIQEILQSVKNKIITVYPMFVGAEHTPSEQLLHPGRQGNHQGVH